MQNNSEHTKAVEVGDIDINTLADIQNISIDSTLSREERIKSYISQIRNPYLYRCDDTIVQVSFVDTGTTLEELLKQYLLSRRRLAF